jgi:hypothetical protein
VNYWYYMNGDTRNGPVNNDEFKDLFVSGTIGPDTMVWTKDLKEWIAARDVDNHILADFCPPPAPCEPSPYQLNVSLESVEGSASKTAPAVETENSGIPSPYIGLSGWLVLPGIGVILSPIIVLVALVPVMKLFFNGSWTLLTTPGTESYTPFLGPLLIAEATVNIGLLIGWIFVAYLFFSKMKAFPNWYIGIMIFTSVFLIMDSVFTSSVFPDQSMTAPDTMTGIVRQILGTIIWSWYMVVSKRVKATFVN